MSNKPVLEETSINAVFGVSIKTDGTIEQIKTGSFDAGQADDIAGQLILLAASIRATARRRLFESAE